MFGTIKFCEENDYIIGDKRYLPENSFTFYSDTHDSVSWLDHAICSAAMFNTISSIDLLYNYLTSDHFVLSIKLDKVYAKQLCNLCDEGFNITRIKWNQLSHDTVSKYTARTDLLLSESYFRCDAVYCTGGENCNEHHRQDLVCLYERITRALRSADKITIHKSSKSNFTPVPGWNELLEEPYNEARNAYLAWRGDNRPRSGPVHEWMKRTRARFKYAQKVAKINEETYRADALAANFDTGNIKGFWKCIKD